LLNVLGGKITTARYLAEDALARLGKATGRSVKPVTRERPFPGGHLPLDYEAFIERSRTLWPFLGAERTVRMVRAYGSALGVMMAQTESESAMGHNFGHGLTALEVDWLIEREWAQTAEDILFRRTKLGLAFDPSQTSELARYIEERANAARD
jgi:glycerol-3-phosphate dehydrogenase